MACEILFVPQRLRGGGPLLQRSKHVESFTRNKMVFVTRQLSCRFVSFPSHPIKCVVKDVDLGRVI